MKNIASGSALAIVLVIMTLGLLSMLTILKSFQAMQARMQLALQVEQDRMLCQQVLEYGIRLAHAQRDAIKPDKPLEYTVPIPGISVYQAIIKIYTQDTLHVDVLINRGPVATWAGRATVKPDPTASSSVVLSWNVERAA